MGVSLFEKTKKVSRNDINQRLSQVDNTFPVRIGDGGTYATNADTARYNLGGDARYVYYQNASGTTSEISLLAPYSSEDLLRLGIYYGINNIQHYTEVPPQYDWTEEHGVLSMQYLQDNGDLLIRTTDVGYCKYRIRVYAGFTRNQCYHFSADGRSWITQDPLYIYAVVGFFKGSGYYN